MTDLEIVTDSDFTEILLRSFGINNPTTIHRFNEKNIDHSLFLWLNEDAINTMLPDIRERALFQKGIHEHNKRNTESSVNVITSENSSSSNEMVHITNT